MKAVKSIVTLSAICATSAFAAEITNYSTPGNLASTHVVRCESISSLSNKHTPADTFRGMSKCLADKNYETAVELYAFSKIYSGIDARRVTDSTARQAVIVLLMEATSKLSKEELKAFGSVAKERLTEGSQSLKEICTKILAIGAPDYRPDYMIQHGMGAFGGNGPSDGVNPAIDVAAELKEGLNKGLHCNI